MEEIFEELDKYYPPENQKIHKYDIKEIISDIIKKMENYFESPESIEEELEVIYNKSKYQNQECCRNLYEYSRSRYRLYFLFS